MDPEVACCDLRLKSETTHHSVVCQCSTTQAVCRAEWMNYSRMSLYIQLLNDEVAKRLYPVRAES